MLLTPHFSLEELIASEIAVRQGISNEPPEGLIPNLLILAKGLELVRVTLGNLPIHVNSGYRCPELNRAVGGAQNSMHMQGLAADILCPQFGAPLAICRALSRAVIDTDQIIHEFGHWCHVAFAAPGTVARKQELTIASMASGYQQGLNPVA